MIYFDNAATSYPKPLSTISAVQTAFTRYGANPGRGGHQMAIETSKMVYRAREQLISLFGGEDAEKVVFTQNCTQGANMAIKGVLRRGDHVIISSMEHNSVWRPVDALEQQGLITYDIAYVDIEQPQRTCENFRSLIRPNTRLLCCVHGSNVFGTIQPVEALCEMAHKAGALFLLDAAQTAGVLDINLKTLPADFVCIAAHKGLYAPTSLGALVVNCDAQLQTILEGGSGSLSMEASMPPFLPDRLEAGTINTTGIAGLLGGLQFVRQHTIQRIYREEMELASYLFEGLSNIGDVILYNRPRLPVLSFGMRGRNGEEIAAELSERGFGLRGGFHCSPLAHRTMGTQDTGTARIGIGAFNTRPQAAALLRAVAAMQK